MAMTHRSASIGSVSRQAFERSQQRIERSAVLVRAAANAQISPASCRAVYCHSLIAGVLSVLL